MCLKKIGKVQNGKYAGNVKIAWSKEQLILTENLFVESQGYLKKKFSVIKGNQCGVNIDPADQVGLWSSTPAIVSTHNQVIKQAGWHSHMEKVNICLQIS